jgi:hypothetical protein
LRGILPARCLSHNPKRPGKEVRAMKVKTSVKAGMDCVDLM